MFFIGKFGMCVLVFLCSGNFSGFAAVAVVMQQSVVLDRLPITGF